MANELKGTVINMKTLSQNIADPIIVGGGDTNGRYLTIIFTQEAAAQFAPNTKVYLSWKHIQKNIKGYNVFTEIPREDTDELTAEEQPPAWYIYYPDKMLCEGDVLARIELVDDISIAASSNFTIKVLADPWDGSDWIKNDDLSEFKIAMNKASNMIIDSEVEHEKLRAAIAKLFEMFDVNDFIDEDGDGNPDNNEEETPTDIQVDDEIDIIEWTGGEEDNGEG